MARVQQKKHAAVTTGSAGNTQPSLRNGFTAYTYSPRGPGCLAPVTRERSTRASRALGLSVGRPGPHDFAVRDHVIRPRKACALMSSRPSHPASNARDDREAPLVAEAGRADRTSDFGKSQVRFRKSELLAATCWHDGQYAHGRSVAWDDRYTTRSSSPRKRGSSIPEAAVLEGRGRGVLDAPLEAGHPAECVRCRRACPGRRLSYATLSRNASSAAGIASGVPTCIHTPSSRSPNSRSCSLARSNIFVSENSPAGAPAKIAGDMIAAPA